MEDKTIIIWILAWLIGVFVADYKLEEWFYGGHSEASREDPTIAALGLLSWAIFPLYILAKFINRLNNE